MDATLVPAPLRQLGPEDLALSPTVVAGYMGHSSADVTERMYLHRERSDLTRGLAAYTNRSNQ